MGWKVFSRVSLGFIWLLSVSVWLGVYLGIWRPYFSVNWRDSECIVQDVTTFKWTVTSDDGDVDYYYASISVLVRVETGWVQGFACGMPNSHKALTGEVSHNGAYPYAHSRCPAPDTCGKMEMLPCWYCSDCHTCKEKVTGQVQACHWTLSPEAWDIDPAQWPLGYRLETPLPHSSYLEVVLSEEVYYSAGEYVFLHVFGAIGIAVPPIGGLVWLVWRCFK